MRTTLTAVSGVSALVALAVLTACTGEPEDSSGAGPTASRSSGAAPSASRHAPVDTTPLESSVRTYVQAYHEPDVDAAYGLLSARCREEWTQESFEARLERAAQAARQLGKTYTLRRLSIDSAHGDSAQVTYGVGDPQFDETSPWTRDDGVWRNDAC